MYIEITKRKLKEMEEELKKRGIRYVLTDCSLSRDTSPHYHLDFGQINPETAKTIVDLYKKITERQKQEEKTAIANEVIPKNQENSIIADFRAKTNKMFHDISEMNPAEIEKTIKRHVQTKINEYGIDAAVIDAVVAGSRCRGLEKENSDLDVVVELSTNEREDDLFNTFNEDELHIGEVRVDINPITVQHTGTLETYLPQVEYLENIRKEKESSKREQEEQDEWDRRRKGTVIA